MFLEKDNLQTYNGCRAIKPTLGFLESECSSLSCVLLFAILVNVAHQAPLPKGYSWQDYWSGLPFPSPGYISDPELEPSCPTLHADSLPSEPPWKPLELSYLKLSL